MVKRLVLFICLLFLVQAAPAENPRTTIKRGIEYYQGEEYEKALSEFLMSMQKAPGREEAEFDLGTALYKLQKYPESMGAFAKVLEKENPELAGDAWFNLGNSLVKDGKLKEAVDAYKNALVLNHRDMDAKYNLETAMRMMKMQQQQQQQQKGESQDSTDQKKSEERQQQQQKNDEEQKQEDQESRQSQSEQESQQDSTQAQPQQQEGEMSEEEAMQLLQAMETDELEAVKEKLRRQFGEPKRVEKDW